MLPVGNSRTCIPKTGYMHGKTKIFKAKSSIEVLYLMLNILQKAMHRASPDLGQVTKFNPKMQNFKRVSDLTSSKVRDFLNWLSNLENFVFSNESENFRN